jgi:hypothetical protein
MTENEKTKEAVGKTEDWSGLPFDEAEDDARWAKLSNELDELAEKVASHEAVFGPISMEADASILRGEETRPKTEDEEIADYEPF